MIKKYALFLILSIGLLLSNYCGHHQKDNSHPLEKNHPHHPLDVSKKNQPVITLSNDEKIQTQIKTITVQENPVQSTLTAMGKVLAPPDSKAIVGYSYPGRIIKIHTTIGQWVKKGTPLLTIECEEVGNAKSEYFKELTQYQLAKQNFEREDRLFKKDIGAQKDLLETKAQLEITRSCLEAAEKKLQVMGFSTQQIQEFSRTININPYVTINSPLEGRVIQNNAVLGTIIDPTNEIMVILNPVSLYIDAEIFEKDLAKIRTGQEVQIAVPAYPSETFVGQISYIGDIIHPETRTITVRTRVTNIDSRLKPGMFADIKILLEKREKAITVPNEALLDNLDKKIIFVQQGDHFICKTVEVGASFNGYIEIKNGLNIGDTIVIEGNFQLKSKLNEETLHQAHVH